MSAADDIVFGLVVAVLMAAAVVAATLAARDDPRGVEPRWVRRSVTFGAGAVGVMGVWVAAIVATAPSA